MRANSHARPSFSTPQSEPSMTFSLVYEKYLVVFHLKCSMPWEISYHLSCCFLVLWYCLGSVRHWPCSAKGYDYVRENGLGYLSNVVDEGWRILSWSDVVMHLMVTPVEWGKKWNKHVIAVHRIKQQGWLCLLSLVYFSCADCSFVLRLLSFPPQPPVSGSVFQTQCETRTVASWHTEGVLVLVAAVHSKVIWHLKTMLCAIAHSLRQACWRRCLAKGPLLTHPPPPLTSLKPAAKCFREEDGLIVSATTMPLLHFSLFPS